MNYCCQLSISFQLEWKGKKVKTFNNRSSSCIYVGPVTQLARVGRDENCSHRPITVFHFPLSTFHLLYFYFSLSLFLSLNVSSHATNIHFLNPESPLPASPVNRIESHFLHSHVPSSPSISQLAYKQTN